MCQVLLVRGCKFDGKNTSEYEVDLLPGHAKIDESLKRDILGGRQRMLFVEGNETSLDKPLYSIVFPGVSVVAKSTCRDVEHAVRGIRDAGNLHWVKAFGIIDGDGRQADECAELERLGLYTVPGYSVEGIYYRPQVQRMVVERLTKAVGGDAERLLAEASACVLKEVSSQIDRLSARIVERRIREDVLKMLPKANDITAGKVFQFRNDPGPTLLAERNYFQKLVEMEDVESIVTRYPLRETGALHEIARSLGFQNRRKYEGAVITLVQESHDALSLVQSFFGNLAAALTET